MQILALKEDTKYSEADCNAVLFAPGKGKPTGKKCWLDGKKLFFKKKDSKAKNTISK